MNNKVCSKCGAAVKAEDKFCMSCGSKEFNEVVQPITPVKTDSGMPTWVKVLIVIGAIVLLLGGCALACVGSFINGVGNFIGNTIESTDDFIDNLQEGIQEQLTKFEDVNGKKVFYVGDSFQSKIIKISFIGVNDLTAATDVAGEYKVVMFDLGFENIGNTQVDVEDDEFTCYADDVRQEKYIPSNDATYSMLDSEINVGKKDFGKIYCQVPINASKVSIDYEYFDEKTVEFVGK